MLNNSCFRFHMDPSGTFIQYDAKAIGSGSEGAQQALQEVYHKVNMGIHGPVIRALEFIITQGKYGNPWSRD
jgi:20S proteasome alpha/beta subunit